MTDLPIDAILARTFDDRRLTRTEKKALDQCLQDEGPDADRLAFYVHRAFQIARTASADPESRRVVTWLEDVVKALRTDGPAADTSSEALFSPGPYCLDRIVHLVRSARRTIDACVFTITDDRISGPLIEAHRRGVRVRIVTDDDKSEDIGSDADRFARAGIGVRTDASESHMHHKFAIFDQKTLVAGSYNWTRSAAESNQEDLITSRDPGLVRQFQGEFDTLWERYGR